MGESQSPNRKLKSEQYSNFGGINQKASLYLTSDNDCLNLINLDFNKPGALSSMPGSSLYYGTTFPGTISGLYEYTKLSGTSYIIVGASTILYATNGATTFQIRTSLTSNLKYDFVTFIDMLFATNEAQFIKSTVDLTAKFSCPPPDVFVPGSTPLGTTLIQTTYNASGWPTGTYKFTYGYLDNAGYFSEGCTPISFTIGTTTMLIVLGGLTTIADYGITQLIMYTTGASSNDFFATWFASAGATTVPLFYPGSASTTFITIGMPYPSFPFFTLAPKAIELFQNSLFLIGSSAFPSSYFWSELGEPENIDPESNSEVRTNDGDILRGGKAYGSALCLFKTNSFVKIVGNDSSNFTQIDVSNEYGCISNRAIVIYNDIMLFLDKKGVCRYNGASPEIISHKVEDTFFSMNLSSAIDQATAVHVKYRNQIWWGIPINGATLNNTTVIYDYLADSWTVRNGFNPAVFAIMQSSFQNDTIFFGGYSGTLNYLSASVFAEAGQGMTFLWQSKFFAMGGPSNTMQYRRLFIDTDPIIGITVPLTVNFRVNEGSSIVLTRQVYFDQFQTRIDFGIPAKSLSVELVAHSASTAIKINGITLESRLQRRV